MIRSADDAPAPTILILSDLLRLISGGIIPRPPLSLPPIFQSRDIDSKLFISVKLFICFRYVKFENH